MKSGIWSVVKKTVFLMVVAFALLLAGRWYAVRKLDGISGSRTGLESAIAKFEADRRVISARVKAVTDSSHRRNLSEADEVVELMGDADLNRLALLYMGADWSVPRTTLRKRIRDMQRRARDCEQALAKLERRLRLLQMTMNAPSDVRKKSQEKADITRQIATLKETDDYRDLIARNDKIGRLVAEYRRDSVERLGNVVSDRVNEQREELSKSECRQKLLTWLDFWPLTKLIPRNAE